MLAVLTPGAGKRIFCAKGGGAPTGGLCTPAPLRGQVRQISAGEVYELGGSSSRGGARRHASARPGLPGCADATAVGAFTPNQLSTAYGVDALHSRGLDGSGVRVATLSSQEVDAAGFRTWAQCFGLADSSGAPVRDAGGEYRHCDGPGGDGARRRGARLAGARAGADHADLRASRPELQQLLRPVHVRRARPGRARAGGCRTILSISDGVCESRFTSDQLQLGRRLLAQAAALGITTLAASGDLGFQGCFIGKPGALFPSQLAVRHQRRRYRPDPDRRQRDRRSGRLVHVRDRSESGRRHGRRPEQGLGPPWLSAGARRRPPASGGRPHPAQPRPRRDGLVHTRTRVFDKDGGGWGIGGGHERRDAADSRDRGAGPPAGAGGGPPAPRLAATASLRARARPRLQLDLLRHHQWDELARARLARSGGVRPAVPRSGATTSRPGSAH